MQSTVPSKLEMESYNYVQVENVYGLFFFVCVCVCGEGGTLAPCKVQCPLWEHKLEMRELRICAGKH